MTVPHLRKLVPCLASLSLACAASGWPSPTAAPDAAPTVGTGDEQERSVDVYVTPYYVSAGSPGDRPHVKVGRAFDPLLSSDRREDVLAARDLVEAQPELVTPMTMMVLAIRLYDVGLRDDAVFWYYVARERYRMIEAVLDVRAPEFGGVPAAMNAFMELVGPYMNGYLFCDVDAYGPLWTRAIDWTEAHPYGGLYLDVLPARPGDRAAHAKAALEERRAQARQASAYFGDPARRAEVLRQRKVNRADERFCWR